MSAALSPIGPAQAGLFSAIVSWHSKDSPFDIADNIGRPRYAPRMRTRKLQRHSLGIALFVSSALIAQDAAPAPALPIGAIAGILESELTLLTYR